MANEEEKEKVQIEKLFSEVLKENLEIQRVNADEIRKQVDLSKALGNEFGGVYKQYALTNEQGKAITKNARDLSRQTANILRDEKSMIEGRRKIKDIDRDINKAKAISNVAIREFEQINIKLERDKTALMMKRINASGKEKESLRAQESVLKNLQRGLQSNVAISKENLEALKHELEIRGTIEKKLGVLSTLVKGIGKIPIVGEFLDANKVLKEMEEKAIDVDSNRFQVMGAGIKEIGRQLNENMLDPLVMISALIGSGLTVDQRVTELERSLGVSSEEALGLENRFQAIASNSGKLAINTKEVTVAFNALNAQIGGAATTFSDELLESSAELIKLNRLSEESAARFALSAQRAGVSLESVKNESIGVINASTQERGLRLDINKVLDEAGKITGVIAAQLGGNVVAISKAISVTKQFGMELEQVAAAGRTLLEFETSIGNELTAELLTGKQINLERARLAALTGDYETLTREINKNVGDFGDFTAMNVLQQEALAASVGMTADQLSDVLLKNKDIEKLAQEARDAGNEDLAQQLEKRSVQEQFNDTVLKLKGIFVDIMSGPLMGFLEVIGKILEKFGNFLGMLGLGKGGFADLVVQIGFFAVLAQKSFSIFTKTITAMKAMKGLTLAQKANEAAINTSRGLGLITQQQSNRAKARATILAANEGNVEKLNNFTLNAGLFTLIKKNAQRKIANIQTKLSGVLENGVNTVRGIGLTIMGKGNLLKRIGNKLGLVDLFRTGGQAVLGGIKAGTKAPFPANVILPFVLGGLIGALVGAAIAKFSKADDIYSSSRGGSGYGSRMLLAPEGAFALNNKDTVIAGTNLFKANDVIMGGEGSVNIDTITSNNQQPSNTNRALEEKLDALNNNVTAQTQAINNKPVAQNTMIDPNSIVNPRIPFEKSSNYTAMT